MSIQARLAQSIKNKASQLRLLFLLLSITVLSSCVGDLKCKVDFADPGINDINCFNPFSAATVVNYIEPQANGVYTQTDLAFEIEFPDGVPTRYEIKINGAKVQSDFVVSGNSLIVPVVSLAASPQVWNALRDGANTFQLTYPWKDIYTFYVDFEDPRIHILSVDDGWNGVTKKVVRDNNFHANAGYGMYSTYFGRSGDFKNAYPVQKTTINSIDVADQFQPHPKRGNVIVEGRVEGEEYAAVSSLGVEVKSLDGSGTPYATGQNGSIMYAIPGTRYTHGTAPDNTSDFEIDFGTGSLTDLGDLSAGTCPAGTSPHFLGSPTAMGTSPVTGASNYCYGAYADSWTPSGQAGLAASGSNFNVPVNPFNVPAPGTTYVIFLQRLGSVSRTFTAPASGNFVFAFYAAQRNTNQQELSLDLDGVEIAKIKASSNAFEGYAFRLTNLVAAQDYTLTFTGLNPNGVDEMMFIAAPKLTQDFDFYVNAYDVGDHDADYAENEGDLIRFTTCKTVIGADTYATNICSFREWLRANIPLNDLRLGKGGGLSAALDQVAFLSAGSVVLGLIQATDLGSEPTDPGTGTWVQKLMLMPPDHPPGTPYASKEGIFMSLPAQPAGDASTLNLDARLDVDLFITLTIGSGWLSITCDVKGTRTESHGGKTYTNVARVNYKADVDLSVDAAGNPVVNLATPTISLANINACSIPIGDLVSLVQDIVNPIIVNIVGGIFANDLPYTRAIFSIKTPLGSQLGPFFLPVQPKLARFDGDVKSGGVDNQWGRKWVMDMGLHMRGVVPDYALSPPFVSNNPSANVRRNVSLGSTYSGNSLIAATLNSDPSSTEAAISGTTLGLSVTEDFVNQAFMGLWESGFLYIDFVIESPPLANPFLTNVHFTFASTQPWKVDIADTAYGDSQPNFLITIPDLQIGLTGDRYWPKPTAAECATNGQSAGCTALYNYEFARMLADVGVYTELTPSPDGKSIRIRMTQSLEVDITEVSSDWDNIRSDQLVVALDYAFTLLTGGLAIDIPFPELLPGMNIDVKQVETDADALYVAADFYSSKCFPGGPDVPGMYDADCKSGKKNVVFNWPANTDSKQITSTGYTYGAWTIKMESDGYVRVRKNGATLVQFGNAASAGGSAYWQGDGHLVFYNGAATWASGWAPPDGTSTSPQSTDSLILLSDGTLMIYDNVAQVIRYTFPRYIGVYLTGFTASDFSNVNTSGPLPAYGQYDSLVNGVDDTGAATFHMNVVYTTSLGNFESGFMCPQYSTPFNNNPVAPWVGANEVQRARGNRSRCCSYTYDGDTKFEWTDPNNGYHTFTVNGYLTVANMQAQWNAQVGAGNIVVSGADIDNSSGNNDMFFTFTGIYANTPVNQIVATKLNGRGSIAMSTITEGFPNGPLPMGTDPITGTYNYCYGATDGLWNGAVVVATGSALGVTAPEGSYVIALQGTANTSRNFTVAADGNYLLTFRAAQRSGSNQYVTVELDGVEVGQVGTTMVTPSFDSYVMALNGLVAGQTYNLKFVGTPPAGDHTIFVDDIKIEQAVDRGFSLNLGQDYLVNAVNLDGRDDCCTNRLDGYRVQLWNDGVLEAEALPITGAQADNNLVTFDYITADEVRLVKRTGENAVSPMNFTEIQVRVNQ